MVIKSENLKDILINNLSMSKLYRNNVLIWEKKAKKYIVTFDANGGSCSTESITVNKGLPIGTLPTAIKEDNIHIGWFLDNEGIDQILSDYIPTKNITCYAIYIKKCIKLAKVKNIIVDPDTLIVSNFSIYNMLSAIESDTINFADGLEIIFRAKTPNSTANQEIFSFKEKDNFEIGIYNNKYMWEIASGSGSTTGINYYEPNNWKYWKVTKEIGACEYNCYIADGEIITDSPDWTLDYGPKVREDNVIGHIVIGCDTTPLAEAWEGQIDIKNSYVKINGEKILFDIDIIFCIVTFDENGHGIKPNKKKVEKDTKISTLPTLEEEGYVFNGWYKNSECTEEWIIDNDIVENDITLYAKWTEAEYDVTLHLNDGVIN